MPNSPATITRDEEELLLNELQLPTSGHKTPYKCHRNVLVFLAMLDAGLRVGEVAGLDICDLVFNQQPVRSIVIRAHTTKNKLERHVPASDRLKAAIEAMIPFWNFFEYNSGRWPAFCARKDGPRLTIRQLERVLRNTSLRIIGKAIHPHQLRHTFATRLMRITSVRVVQQLLGHLQLSSTQIYTHPSEQDRTDAIKRLNSVAS